MEIRIAVVRERDTAAWDQTAGNTCPSSVPAETGCLNTDPEVIAAPSQVCDCRFACLPYASRLKILGASYPNGECLMYLGPGEGFVVQDGNGGAIITNKPCFDLAQWFEYVRGVDGYPIIGGDGNPIIDNPPKFPFIWITDPDGCLRKVQGAPGRTSVIKWEADGYIHENLNICDLDCCETEDATELELFGFDPDPECPEVPGEEQTKQLKRLIGGCGILKLDAENLASAIGLDGANLDQDQVLCYRASNPVSADPCDDIAWETKSEALDCLAGTSKVFLPPDPAQAGAVINTALTQTTGGAGTGGFDLLLQTDTVITYNDIALSWGLADTSSLPDAECVVGVVIEAGSACQTLISQTEARDYILMSTDGLTNFRGTSSSVGNRSSGWRIAISYHCK